MDVGSLSTISLAISASPCAAARPRAITNAAAAVRPSAKATMRIRVMDDHLFSVCYISDPPTVPGWQSSPTRE
jgi:hypothetical protein